MDSAAGKLIGRAADLLFAGKHGIPVKEPTLEEFRAMQALENARSRIEQERYEEEKEQREH